MILKNIPTLLLLGLIWSIGTCAFGALSFPKDGALVSAYVDAGPAAEDVDAQKIQEFQEQINKKLAWAYFSNNWVDGIIEFPFKNIHECQKAVVIPYIRMLPWVEMRNFGPDPYYTMDAFLSGKFDTDLKRWAQNAKDFAQPLIVEFGPEVNGKWFAWNGYWNGKGETKKYGNPQYPDGPEKFRDVYRRIIEIFRQSGAHNVTWVFHVDTAWEPLENWNQAKYYYPGDEYIDWIGLSVFGAQLPKHDWIDFTKKLKNFWPQIQDLKTNNPIIISEFAVIEDPLNPLRKAQWLARALRLIRSKAYPIKAISYWNSPGWLANGSADFRLTSSESSLKSFKEELTHPFWHEGDQLQLQEVAND